MKIAFILLATIFFQQQASACDVWGTVKMKVNFNVKIQQKTEERRNSVSNAPLLQSVSKEIPISQDGLFPAVAWEESFEVDGIKFTPSLDIVGLPTMNQISVRVNCVDAKGLECGTIKQMDKTLKDLEGLVVSPDVSSLTIKSDASEKVYKPELFVSFEEVTCGEPLESQN